MISRMNHKNRLKSRMKMYQIKMIRTWNRNWKTNRIEILNKVLEDRTELVKVIKTWPEVRVLSKWYRNKLLSNIWLVCNKE